MNSIQKYVQKNPQQVAIGVLTFFLVTGFVQAALGLEYVIRLTPVMLAAVICAAVVFWEAPTKPKLKASAIIVLGGFIIEVIGVQSGLLFGDYSYGKTLGFMLFGVPLTIGLTWLLVSLSAWHIVMLNSKPLWQKFLLGGLLVVMFDLVLEQFASAYGLWSWRSGVIPLYNYICWFVITMVWFFVLNKLTPKSRPSIFIVSLLPLMGAFFWLMLVIS